MKVRKRESLARTVTCAAGLAIGFTSPLAAQNPFDIDIRKAFEQQIEKLSRLLPDDPAAQEQFKRGFEEMKEALEEGQANGPGSAQPRTFEFHWEGSPGDGGDLSKEFERFFRRGLGGDGTLMEGFHPRGWFEMEKSAPPEQSKNHPDELRKFRPVVEATRPSTIRVLSGGNQVSLGTIVTENGYALAKRSELGRGTRTFEAEMADGSTVSARLVDEVADYDLALLKLDARGLTPVQFTEASLPLGSFLVASDVNRDPAATGVLSVLERNLSPKSKGYLGIGVRSDRAGVGVAKVERDSAAAAAGIRPNDIITEIDGKAVASPPQLIKAVSGMQPDAIVEINYLRNGRPETTSAKLRSREELAQELARLGYSLDRSGMDVTSRLGADISRQRGGYPSAIQHDLPLDSNQMGGPLLDLDGNVIGLNIARSGRVSTLALPAIELNRILAELELEKRERNDRPVTPLPPVEAAASNTSALREEVDLAEQAIEAARQALRDAEERASAARKAIELQER